MKKVLGLDIGTNSIGWALVEEPETELEQYKISRIGVRIIPLSSDENDEFTKGNAISKNAKRTLKRGARRNLHRYKLRKQQLTAVLKSLNMFPSYDLFQLDSLSLYGLRAKALSEKISLPEIGRIFYHLNQKRGYKSNRKANNEEEKVDVKPAVEAVSSENSKTKKKGYLDLINDREFDLKNEGLTIGQHFYRELQKNSLFRIKENIYMRSSYMDEFDRIWDAQKEYYHETLTDANKHIIRNEIIYYHRPLKSQKGLVSNCLFEKNHKAAPKSSPLFQVAKIWQELNNIEITSFKAMLKKNQENLFDTAEKGFDKYGKRHLTLEEKQALFEKLNLKGKLTTKELLTELGYKSGYNEYKLNIRNEKELEGNRTLAAIKKIFDSFAVKRDELLQFNLLTKPKEKVDKQTGEITSILTIDESFEQEPLYKLWHLLYSIEDDEPLLKKLQNDYGFTEEQSKALAKIDFQKQGYGSLSARALRNILPYLQQGETYDKACKKSGYNHSASITKEDNEVRTLLDKLELYPKNSLRQPVVEKIINQVINLVNEIIDEKNGFVTNEERYAKDKFEIRVELARELRQNAEERNKTYSRNSKMDRKHKEISDILKKELDFKRVSRNDIERYKLWEEFNYMSPYEPNRPVSLSEVFNQVQGRLYDIEHIIPKSRLFDDSFNNKTICPRTFNSGNHPLAKNQMTAYDYMKSRGEKSFNDYLEFIKSHLYKKDGISKAKFEKLMMSVEKIPEDFINRQLQETRFISREIRKLLSQICRNVHATSGPVTDYLRHHWGYDYVLQKLNWHKYEAIGKTIIEEDKYGKPLYKIIDWSKRDDHRHHAIDALVIACTKQSYIQQLNNLNQTVEKLKDETNQDAVKRINIRTQVPFTFEQVSNVVSGILISFKPGKKVGSNSINKIKKGRKVLHEKVELTPRGFLHKETVYGRIRQYEKVPLSTRFNRFSDIAEESIKQLVEKHLIAFNDDPKIAFNAKNLKDFKENTGLESIPVYKYEHVVRYKLDGNFKAADAEYIVDLGIRNIIKKRLAEFGNNAKEAFKDLASNPIWLNKEKGISIKSVRCFTGLNDLQPLHKNALGNPVDFVSTRNNHHIAIYQDENGKLVENTVTFWDALERKKSGLPAIVTEPKLLWDELIESGFDNQEILNKLPKDSWTYITSLQQNEMFVFGLNPKEIDFSDTANYELISRHLYRVQKMSKKSSGAIDIWFRHHLETKLDDTADAKKIKKFLNIRSLSGIMGIKVKINNLGRIVKVGEDNYSALNSDSTEVLTA